MRRLRKRRPRLIGARSGIAALLDENGRLAGVITPIDLCGGGNGTAPVPRPPRAARHAGAADHALRCPRNCFERARRNLRSPGTAAPDGALEAILTASELALFCGQNPTQLTGAIRAASSAAEIAPLLASGQETASRRAGGSRTTSEDCCRIAAEAVAALAEACIRLARCEVLASGIEPPGASSGWLMFGAPARGDLLQVGLPRDRGGVRTIQPLASAAKTARITRRSPARLPRGSTTADWPAPNGRGLKGRSRACRSRNGGGSFARPSGTRLATISTRAASSSTFGRFPGILPSSKGCQRQILLELRDDEAAIPLLANDTLAHLPPLTFFRGLVLDLDGGQRDTLDIASAAISPIADARPCLRDREAPSGSRQHTWSGCGWRRSTFRRAPRRSVTPRRRFASRSIIRRWREALESSRGPSGNSIRGCSRRHSPPLSACWNSPPPRSSQAHDSSKKHLAAFENTWTDDTPAGQVRFVALDTETTGLDPKRDRLITIGAVAVRDGEILLEDSFEAMLKVAYNNSSVTVHGITRDEALGGMEEPEALALFLDYLRDGVIVGHHIGHDIQALNCACERHFNLTLQEPVARHHGFDAAPERRKRLCGPADGRRVLSRRSVRHVRPLRRTIATTAGGDAFLTAPGFSAALARCQVGRAEYPGFALRSVRAASSLKFAASVARPGVVGPAGG